MKMKRSALVLLATAALGSSGCLLLAVSAGAESARHSMDRKNATVQEQIIIGNAKQSGYSMPMAEKEAYAAEMLKGGKADPAECPETIAFTGEAFCATFVPDYNPFLRREEPTFRGNLYDYLKDREGQQPIAIMGRWELVKVDEYKTRSVAYAIGGVQVMQVFRWRMDGKAYVAIVFPH